MADKAIEIQNQIRNNAQSLRDYVTDLGRWEDEVNALDQSLSKKKKDAKIQKPIRAQIFDEAKVNESEKKLRRDRNNMFDYYEAWDKFDPDEELKNIEDPEPPKLEQPTKVALPRSKVIIKGGRNTTSDIDRTKDQANLYFTTKEYIKALESYQKCLELNPNDELKALLFSNKAECFLRLNKYFECESEATKALDINKFHTKSLVRRGKARRMLGKFKSSIEDFDAAIMIEPQNTIISQEKTKTEKRRQKKISDIISEMTSRSRLSKFELVRLLVQDTNLTETIQKKVAQAEEVKVAVEKFQDLTKKATESIPIQNIPIPKTIAELQRNWAMLSNNKDKLKEYMKSINYRELFLKGSIESDFLMQITQGVFDCLLDDHILATDVLDAVSKCKNIGSVIKFLTQKEKAKIQELILSLGGSEQLKPLLSILSK